MSEAAFELGLMVGSLNMLSTTDAKEHRIRYNGGTVVVDAGGKVDIIDSKITPENVNPRFATKARMLDVSRLKFDLGNHGIGLPNDVEALTVKPIAEPVTKKA